MSLRTPALLLLLLLPAFVFAQVKPAEFPALEQVNQLISAKKYPAADSLLTKIISQNKTRQNKLLLAGAYRLSGSLQLTRRNFDLALKQFFLSLDHLDSLQNKQETSRVYSNIGTVYAMTKNLPDAREYYQKALVLNPEDNPDRLKTLSNLAGIYMETGRDKSAALTFQQAIQLAVRLHDQMMEAILQTNLANDYLRHKQWKKAIAACNRSIFLRNKENQPAGVITLNNLGYALAQSGDPAAAISTYQQALPMAAGQEKKQLLYNLYQAEKSAGNPAKALWRMEQYTQLNDSLIHLNYDNKLAELTASYKAAERQRQISALKRKNTRQQQLLRQQNYLMLASALILILISMIIYMRVKNHNVRQALGRSQLQRQLLLLQLNPHFIFNALQSVQQYIYNRNQQHAMEYLSSFSRLIRLVLENSDREQIPLNEEIEMLDNYLRLQQMEHQSGFTYTIETGPGVEPELMEIPVMLLQPFVENAVVHGMRGQGQGKILVRFAFLDHRLHIWIKDNGQGPQQSPDAADRTLHRSMGMSILERRLAELNKDPHKKIKLTIIPADTADAGYPGTAVHFQFQFT